MKKSILKYGIFYGAAHFGLTQAYYFGTGVGLIDIIVFLAVFVVGWLISKDYKRYNKGYADFGGLLKKIFLTVVLGSVISLALTLVQAQFIAEETKENIVEIRIESSLSLSSSQMNDEDLMEMEDKLREEMTIEKLFGFKNLIFEYFGYLFVYLIESLIAAGIFKKTPKTAPEALS